MVNKALQITFANSALEARAAVARGECPVECSFGHESIVDALQMDHHGSLSHLESVAVRAWRDGRNARADDPRFVVTGAADADATFAIAALAGALPPGDWSDLAQLIAIADTAPVCLLDFEPEPAGILLLWKQMSSGIQDAAAFYAGVDRWRALLSSRIPRELVDGARAAEKARVDCAMDVRIERHGERVAVVEAGVPAFDVWYARIAPVIVAYVASQQRITIGVRDDATAVELFGEHGLLDVAARLSPLGWGGRATVIGSPRGMAMSRADASSAARMLAECL